MGRRSRRRGAEPLGPTPQSSYRSSDGEQTLTLRGAMTVATRGEYAKVLGGVTQSAAATQEDSWQRAVEFLFERLVVSWEIAGAEPLTKQTELLGRYRFASADERKWIRTIVRSHLAEHFPDLEAP